MERVHNVNTPTVRLSYRCPIGEAVPLVAYGSWLGQAGVRQPAITADLLRTRRELPMTFLRRALQTRVRVG